MPVGCWICIGVVLTALIAMIIGCWYAARFVDEC